MTRLFVSVCALFLVGPVAWTQSTAFNASPGTGQSKSSGGEPKEPGSPAETAPAAAKKPTTSSGELRRILATTIEMPVGQRLIVRDVLQWVADKIAAHGQRLDVFVDQGAMKLQVPDLQDFLDLEIRLPREGQRLTVQQVLEQIASETAAGIDVTYLLRQRRIEIVPVENARIDYLLDRGVTIEFKDTPVSQALDELSDAAGLTIAVDPRCGNDVLTKPVSLRAGQDMSVRGVLECLADMNDLRLIIDEHRVFLTTETQYLKRLRSRLEEAKLHRELEAPAGAYPVPPGGSFTGGLGGPGGLGGGVIAPPREPERPRQYGRRPRVEGAQ